jgi:hypothetical protein
MEKNIIEHMKKQRNKPPGPKTKPRHHLRLAAAPSNSRPSRRSSNQHLASSQNRELHDTAKKNGASEEWSEYFTAIGKI